MQIDLTNPEVVGQHTPDPLRFAFSKKRAAHAGGMSHIVPAQQVQSTLMQAYATPPRLANTPRCLYLHVPFCRVRCTFCNFFQYASSKALIARYVESLCEEIRWKATSIWAQAAPFQAVYIGGGTPTDLSGEQILRIMAEIKRQFPLTPDCEITLEGRVNRFSEDKFEAALEAGINRFSFGVQSFNTQVRKSAKRLDDREHVLAQLSQYVSYNAAPIVIDLLFGLPHQTMEIWQQDLNDYLASGVHGVDLYQLLEMQGIPMASLVEQGKLPMPADTQMKASMYALGVAFMERHYQRRVSVSHWANDNRERSIYNSLAKTTAEIMPLGAGGGGNLNGLQMMQTRNLDQYIQSITERQYPVPMLLRTHPHHGSHACIKAAFDKGVLASAALDKAAGAGTFNAAKPLFEAWQRNGLVTLSASPVAEGGYEYVTLTLAGQFWAVTLSQILIEVLQTNLATAA
ncbi:MAG: heme anaerobic degradation radical SAM methyltransferase ChuW/HutW [Shewanella sp.]|uniref:heme anaerobic degradation radical SAM methyltransferase ChuW/HutW n=1 Tax=Shewanella sp. TaxID=50422 RepID=UPI003F37A155